MIATWYEQLDAAVKEAFPGVECKTDYDIFAGICGNYVTRWWQTGTESKKLKPALARQVKSFVAGFMACRGLQDKYYGYPLTFRVYRDARGEWRWKLTAKNNRTVADSAEGYKRKGTILAQIERIQLDAHYSSLEVDQT